MIWPHPVPRGAGAMNSRFDRRKRFMSLPSRVKTRCVETKGRGRLKALLMILLLAFVLVGCNADRTAAVRELNVGMEAFQAGSASEAVQHMEEALRIDPTFAEAAYLLGQVYQMRLDNYEEAARGYRRALDLEPTNAQYAYRLGTALVDQGKLDEAVTQFEKAVANDETFSRAWFRLGLAQDSLGKHTDAVASYTRAIETNPRLRMSKEDPGGEHYHALADLYLRFGLSDHAVQVYENGVQNNATSTRLLHGLGVARMELGRFDEAAESFEATMEQEPGHGSANFNLAVAHHRRGDTAGAVAQLESFLASGAATQDEARQAAAQALLTELQEEE
ncbi:tetratricopeptide repeat protein [Lujinxingia vulgaris]|uniref:Tetratricopeptide repeat protein n=2 Tax=Lujinxingia vulgaris TaxID=2600176 RepID=A0A5C6XAH6_9DELT|nr:tetratricopeptide repeat protein [Lujinxingia vulgaris]